MTNPSILKAFERFYQRILDIFADKNHNHDDNYYTETEVDEKIAESAAAVKSDLLNGTISGDHIHSWNNIIDKPFEDNSVIYWEKSSNFIPLETVEVSSSNLSFIKIDNNYLTYEQMQNLTISVMNFEVTLIDIQNNNSYISANLNGIPYVVSVLNNAEIEIISSSINLSPGLWTITIDNMIVEKIYQNGLKTLDTKFIKSHWLDIKGRPFGGQIQTLYNYNNKQILDKNIINDAPFIKVSDVPLSTEVLSEEINISIISEGNEEYLTITPLINDNYINGELFISILSTTTIENITFSPGLWIIDMPGIIEIYKIFKEQNIQPIDEKYLPEITKLPSVSTLNNNSILKVINGVWSIGTDEIGVNLPTISSSDNGKVLGVSNGTWVAKILDKELPIASNDDNGKVLGIVNGAWAITDCKTETALPEVSEEDNGKTLIVEDGIWSIQELPKTQELPEITAEDNGKILSVVEGGWALASFATEEWTFTLEDGTTVTKAVYIG